MMFNLKQKNIWLQIIGLSLIAVGIFLSEEKIVIALVGKASERFDTLLNGAAVLKITLLIEGILLVFLGRTWQRWKNNRNNTLLLDKFNCNQLHSGLSKTEWIILGIILIIAFFLRIIKLNQGMWFDEVVTLVSYVRPDTAEIITNYSNQNQHFLYSLFAHFSISLFGESVWALRLPAVLFGVGGIGMLYLLARNVTGKTEALLSALLLTFSYHHVWFSQNARGFSGLLFWTLATSWLFLLCLKEGRWYIWVFYIIGMVLGLYTHLTMIFVLLCHGIIYSYILITSFYSRNQINLKPLWVFGFIGILTLQCYSLVLPQVLDAFLHNGGSVSSEWNNPFWALHEIVSSFQRGYAGNLGLIAAFVFFCFGLYSYAKENRIVAMLLILPGVIGTAIIILLHYNFRPRFFFYILGFGTLVLVRGTMVSGQKTAKIFLQQNRNSLFVKHFGTAICVCIIVVSAWSLRFAYYPKQDYIGARTFVEKHRKEGEPVVTIGHTSIPWRTYYAPDWLVAETLEQLNVIRARGEKTWLLYTFPIYMKAWHPELYQHIQDNFMIVKKFYGTLGDGTIFVCCADPLPVNSEIELPEFQNTERQ